MPTLKSISCCVEWSSSNQPLQEYQTTFADGYVESYIAVPSTPSSFSIQLRSDGYIAPGLAMFVYMDGVYQCNRNRHNLVEPGLKTKRRQTEVSFHVRQKEERMWDGTFRGKQWRFEKVNIVPDSSVNGSERAPYDGEYVGSIEVVVLRCFGGGAIKPIGNLSSPTFPHKPNKQEVPVLNGGMFDGASDSKKRPFGLDGSYDSPPPPPRRIRRHDSRMGSSVPATKSPTVDTCSDSQQSWSTGSVPSMSNSGAQNPGSRHASLDHYRSDWDSIGYKPEVECTSARKLLQNHLPYLHLRGGAPGSYNPSPLASGGGVYPVENQNFQPNADEWNPPPVPPWDPEAQAEQRDAWGELKEEPQGGTNAAAASSWDVPTNGNGWDNPPQGTDQEAELNPAAENANSWDPNNNNNQQQDNHEWNGGIWNGATSHQAGTPKANERPVTQQKRQSPSLTFGNSLAGGSKTAPAGKARSLKSASSTSSKKSKPFGMTWIPAAENGNANKSKESSFPAHKTTSIPGQWSPPPKSEKAPLKAAESNEAKTIAPQPGPILSMSNAPKAKSYWTSWKKPGLHSIEDEDKVKTKARLPDPVEEPIYSVCAEIASRTNLSHQVRPLRAAAYTHKLSSPKYMDTHDDPYAVFVFKYRDRAIIENMIQTTVADPAAKETSELLNMSKAELVKELVRTKEKLSAVGSSESDKVSFKSYPVGAHWGVADLDAVNKKLENLSSSGKAGVGSWVRNTVSQAGGSGSTTNAIKKASEWGANPMGGGAWSTNQQGNTAKSKSPHGKASSDWNNNNGADQRWGSNGDNGNQGGGASFWDNDQSNGQDQGWGDSWGNVNDDDHGNGNSNGNDDWAQNDTSNDNQGNNSGWDNDNINAEENNDGNGWGNDKNGATIGGDDGNGGNGNGQSGDAGWGSNANNGGGGGGNGNSDWGGNNVENNGGDTTGGASADNGGW